jgi:hypothetical protein
MNRTALQWAGHALVVVAAAALGAGCADESPLGPDRRAASAALSAGVESGRGNRAVDLGGCDELRAPAGSRLAFHVYAEGVQIYRWNGTSWTFVAPSALLFADAGGHGVVGSHYGGPTWRSVSGGTSVGTVVGRCTADPSAIPWLLLSAVSAGPGVLHGTTSIQRVNTVGGTAPSTPGSFTGEQASVPYTAEYFFYRGP